MRRRRRFVRTTNSDHGSAVVPFGANGFEVHGLDQLWVADAAAAANASDPTGVASSLERLLVFEPGLSNIRFELGILYLRLGAIELARQYLTDALLDPAVPPAIRERGIELVDEAEAGSRPWQFGAFVALGLRHDSNANSGPDGTVQFVSSIGEVEGRLRPEDTGQSDWSASVRLSGRVSYDLGTQAGHQFVLPGVLYLETYRERSELNLGYANIGPGIEFDLSNALGLPAQVTLASFFSHLSRDGESYLDEAGLSVEGAVRREDTLWRAGISGKRQNFHATVEAPQNDDRDGGVFGGYLGAAQEIGERTQISGEVFGWRKTADADFESYREYGAAVRVRRLFDPGVLNRHGAWEAGILLSHSSVDYDDLDLSIDLDTAQRDRRTRIEGQLVVPVSDDSTVTAQLGYYENRSNFAIRAYDNVYFSMEFGKSF